MAFDMNSVNQQMSSSVDSAGNDMATMINQSSGQDMSEQDLLKLQYSMNRWNMMISMESNIQKTWADTLKSVISNMR